MLKNYIEHCPLNLYLSKSEKIDFISGMPLYALKDYFSFCVMSIQELRYTTDLDRKDFDFLLSNFFDYLSIIERELCIRKRAQPKPESKTGKISDIKLKDLKGE